MRRLSMKAAIVCLLGTGVLLMPNRARAAQLMDDCGPWCMGECPNQDLCGACPGAEGINCVEPWGGCTLNGEWNTTVVVCNFAS